VLKGQRVVSLILFVILIVFPVSTALAQEKPRITAEYGVLLDQETGTVIYEKNAHVKRPPASTTKIMTVLLALEKGDLNKVVKVSPKAAKTGESSMHLRVGEAISLRSLVYGAMLRSGNDACVAISEAVGGTEAKFVRMMNQKAKEIGALNTNFVNTNGLPSKQHYSSCYDLAMISREALKNKQFREIVSTKEIVAMTNIIPASQRYMKNTNKLLWRYPWADGVKTGTTNEAGPCLVSSATRDERKFIGVVLHSDDRFYDSQVLFDYGFNNFFYQYLTNRGEYFDSLPVKDGKSEKVRVVIDKTIYGIFHKDKINSIEKQINLKRNLTAPLTQGIAVGEIRYALDGKLIDKCNLILEQSVLEKSPWEKIRDYLKRRFL
jgi:serine-type D-Ala-D-Ala carboxypeptidase (penicillin-binding protein 5/6)